MFSKIKELRLSKGLTQQFVADKLGVHRTHLGKLERGERTVMPHDRPKLAKVLKVKSADLFTANGLLKKGKAVAPVKGSVFVENGPKRRPKGKSGK